MFTTLASPASLATAESYGRTGRSLIEALVAAYEVHLRLCDHAGRPTLWGRGWHNTTLLQFSTAAAAARLINDDPGIIAQAMAIAATHHNTLAELQGHGIGSIKATADGTVAQSAVEAALLAAYGITGPERLFEGKAGWSTVVAGDVDLEGLLAPLGDKFRIGKVCIKPYPCVGSALAPVHAAIELFRSGARPEDVEQIVIRLPQYVMGTPTMDEAKRFPANKETADHSHQYCVAVALLDGACDDAQFIEAKFTSPQVRALLAKASVEADPEFTALWPQSVGGGVVLKMRDGTTIERRCPYPPGHPHNRLDTQQLSAKFNRLSSEIFPKRRSEAIIAAVAALEQCENISEFTRLLALPAK